MFTVKEKNPYKEEEIFAKLVGTKVSNSGNTKEELEITLQKFKRRMEKSGILDEYKERQFYLKPSLQKRNKRK